jgi:hypothetical protein
VDWSAGVLGPGHSNISVGNDPFTEPLYEGQDYYIENDGKAHYYDGPPSMGLETGTDHVNRDASEISSTIDSDLGTSVTNADSVQAAFQKLDKRR